MLSLLLLLLPPLSYYCATKHFAADTKFPGVVELTTQLLILENILWLPLCRINKFGLNTLTSKAVVIPYTCGLSVYPVGKIKLEVSFGDEHDSRAEKLTFEVVKIKSPYHALFGRPAYAKFMARPCYVYLQLKMT